MIEWIIGPARSGKTERCYREIQKQLQKSGYHRLIMLVPEQFNLQVQIELAKLLAPGLLRVEVISFKNLAEKVLSEVGGAQIPLIDDLERVMILKKILEEHKNELEYFKKSYHNEGFLDSMNQMITVFEQNGVDTHTLEKTMEKEELSSVFKCKMHDIRKIYGWFNGYLEGRFVTIEKTMERLAKSIEKSEYLEGATVWIDGFYGFTAPQSNIIQQLMHKVENLVLTLPMDKPYTANTFVLPTNPFYDSIKNYQRLLKRCEEDQLKYVVTALENIQATNQSPLHYMEANYLKPYTTKYEGENQDVRLYTYANKEEEIEKTAQKIRYLTREKGYRYHDIAVLVGDIGHYKSSLMGTFKEYGIPVFIDDKRSIHTNTLVAVIQAVFDVIIGGFSYKSVMSLLRMQMFDLSYDEVDYLENYLLEQGIKGLKKWEAPWERESSSGDLDQLNGLRERVLAYVLPLKEQLEKVKDTKGHLTVKAATIALYEFLEAIGAYEKIQEHVSRYQQMGEVALEKENTQIWAQVMDTLDRLVDLLGEEKVSLTVYRNLLKTSFSYIKMGIIPPSQDQVIVGAVERTRIPQMAAVFVLGVNEGMIPKVDEGVNLFSEMDKMTLGEICAEEQKDSPIERLGIALVDQPLFSGQFLVYATLTRAKERLVVSTYQADELGKSQRPSLVFYKLRKMFGESTAVQDELEGVQSPLPTLGFVGSKLRQYLESNEEAFDELIWRDTLSWYMRQPLWNERIKILVKDFGYTNQQHYLKKENAKLLYPNGLETNISQLEAYRNCPCCYFIKYGIRASERKMLQWNAADLGTLFHATLERYPKELNMMGTTWTRASQEELREGVKKAVTYSISRSSYANRQDGHIKYIIKRIERMSTRAIHALTYQLQQGDFEPEAYEVNFGGQGLPAIQIKLDDEHTVLLKGQIDRVDVYVKDDASRYIKILDYKTSQKSFSLIEVYHSLQLQLLLYLDAYLRLNPYNKPAGMFYFHIDTKSIKYELGMQPDDAVVKQLQQFKLSGLVLENLEIIESLEHGIKGEVIPAKAKKDGTLAATSSVATEHQFEELRTYMLTCIKKIATEILNGRISAKPCKLKEKDACTYCKYATICQFENGSIDNSYEKLEPLKDKEIWERICHVQKGDEN